MFRSRAACYYHDLIKYFVEFPLGDFTAKFVVSCAVRLQTSKVILLRQLFESGAVLITMQHTHPAWPVKTKLRMTLDWSGIANETAMMGGIFVESRRQTLLYPCKRQE